ncbi:alpha/beta hydrolase [Streptomyces sp. B6B3]|uniref:alpha/beta fold hydrolase n=1 Tax=Streptomyces sp. B6B3 TaxID=3153570 RepID=UPI00325EAF30
MRRGTPAGPRGAAAGPRPTEVRELTVVSTGGARLHTRIHGPDGAPTVVLVHGWTCQARFWNPVLRLLLPDHRVVVYDQRGHGRSPATPGSCCADALADDLCAVLAASVPAGERAVVGGHSMGAMSVVAAAGRPELAERAAAGLLCSTGVDRLDGESVVLPLRPGPWRGRAQRLLLRNPLPYGPVTPLFRRIVRHVTLGPGADPALLLWTSRMVRDCPPGARAEWGRVLATLDLAERLPRLDLPVTVLHGSADRLTPPVHARRLAQRLPRCAGLIELQNLGHMTPLEDPAAVAEALRGLVREHVGASAARAPTPAVGDGPGTQPVNPPVNQPRDRQER